MKNLRGYISSREFMDERCPQHIQNLALRNYCSLKSYNYLLSGTEYAMKNSYLMLEQVIKEIPKVDGIVAYSLFQMPESKKNRMQIYTDILGRNGEIHFALENLKIEFLSEIETVENIWKIRQSLPRCLKNLN